MLCGKNLQSFYLSGTIFILTEDHNMLVMMFYSCYLTMRFIQSMNRNGNCYDNAIFVKKQN